MKKVCVVTGSRADYGLLRWVMQGMKESDSLRLQIVATGSHLSVDFGNTFREIVIDGFEIDCRVNLDLNDDSAVGVSKSMAQAIQGVAGAFEALKPDLVVILGDRYEIWAAAVAATIANIPIAHLHGGEVTLGAIDEAIRHGITKMSHLHFVATEEFRQRVIQLGESPDRVFTVGAFGLDNIDRLVLLDRHELELAIQAQLSETNILITFHPVTLQVGQAREQISQILNALRAFPEAGLFFTLPNADTESQVVREEIERFVAERDNAYAFASLGQLRYLSLLKHVDVVLGNSSSGIIEAPALFTPTVNLGLRQQGRPRAESVFECEIIETSIYNGLTKVLAKGLTSVRSTSPNPYGEPGASKSCVREIENCSLSGITVKNFRDLPLT